MNAPIGFAAAVELHRLTNSLSTEPSLPSPLDTARTLIRQRRARSTAFPQLAKQFNEPLWNLLIELYVLHEEGAEIDTSSACACTLSPNTTALRYIQYLVAKGLLIRRPDPTDRRRAFIELSDLLHGQMTSYLRSIAA
jgi:DNA-binding MarR family transcriptional regulator